MMVAHVPSPIGHVLAGLSVGWLSEPAPQGLRRPDTPVALTPFTLWCAAAAALPDADLLVTHFHRSATHSLTATALVLIVAAVVTGKVTRPSRWTFVGALGLAHATHLLLDWLGTDRFPPPGIQLLWPFSRDFFISHVDLFPPVERRIFRPEAFRVTAAAALVELAVLGPLALAALWVRRRRVRKGSSEFGVSSDTPQETRRS